MSHSRSFLSFVFFSLFFYSVDASAAGALPDIGQMFANFSSSARSLIHLVAGAAFLLGLIVSFQGAMALKDYSDSGGRTQFKTPLGMMIVGAFLMAYPGTINMATETLSLGSNTALEVFSTAGQDSVPGMSAAITGILLFVKLLGHIAIVRGLLMIKKVSEGNQQNDMGRALFHIFGGAAAVNINATINIFSNTFGLPVIL